MIADELKGTTVYEPQPTESCSDSTDDKHDWNKVLHLSMTDRSITTYSCRNCNEQASVIYYRTDDELAIWE